MTLFLKFEKLACNVTVVLMVAEKALISTPFIVVPSILPARRVGAPKTLPTRPSDDVIAPDIRRIMRLAVIFVRLVI